MAWNVGAGAMRLDHPKPRVTPSEVQAGIGFEQSSQLRASLQALVEAKPALEFAGGAANANALADCLAGSTPDVVVTDK